MIAFSGVVMASVYALRLFIRAMHNRVGPKVESRDISVRDGLVLVPLVAVILFLALYPQFALHRSEGSVKTRRVRGAGARAQPPRPVPLLRRHGEHRRDREHRTMNHLPLFSPALATATLKGPHVDFAGLSPLIALLGGAVWCCSSACSARKRRASRRCPRSAWSRSAPRWA